MTSINETTKQTENPKLKTNYEKSRDNISLTTNYVKLEDFQKQVEETVTRRFDLFCNLYLEQIKFVKGIAETSAGSQQKILSKWGLKIDTQSEFHDMVDAWSNVVRDVYSNQTSHLEMVLNMLHQNMRMTNMSMDGFAKLIWSNYSWWIPQNQKPSTIS